VSSGRTLVLGWGNPGRRDDGLGPALAGAVATMGLPGVTAETGYQLQVEDAMEVARHERVLFVDADRAGEAPFSIRRVAAAGSGPGFTSHSLAPAQLLALARDLFGAEPEAWLLGVRGYDFDEFGEGLSVGAAANLAAATEFVRAAVGADRVEPPPAAANRIHSPSSREVDHD
jgi:hydrogenase maturation protease